MGNTAFGISSYIIGRLTCWYYKGNHTIRLFALKITENCVIDMQLIELETTLDPDISY